MPHRRTIKNGSFGARLEELIEHFRHRPGGGEPPETVERPSRTKRMSTTACSNAPGASTRGIDRHPPA